MGNRRKYRKKTLVTAVQLNLVTDGFVYEKWGSEQRCRAGDWIVHGEGDTYTVSEDSFAQTYEEVSLGVYRKVSPIWAEPATESGSVVTKEGRTQYKKGDYLVCNNEDGSDAYAISKARFDAMYELAE